MPSSKPQRLKNALMFGTSRGGQPNSPAKLVRCRTSQDFGLENLMSSNREAIRSPRSKISYRSASTRRTLWTAPSRASSIHTACVRGSYMCKVARIGLLFAAGGGVSFVNEIEAVLLALHVRILS
jgi:hypothetical protein